MNSIKTILIIEDNVDSILLYGEILRGENFHVVETADGKQATEFLENNHIIPDLIIMDLSFPHMTAEEFVANLRSRASWANIPLLVISGHVETQERARGLNANGFLKKPFDLEEFISAVKTLASSSGLTVGF